MAGSGTRTSGSRRGAGGTTNPSMRQRIRGDQPLSGLSDQYRGLRSTLNSARTVAKQATTALAADRFNPARQAAYRTAQEALNRAFTAAEAGRFQRRQRLTQLQKGWLSQNPSARPRSRFVSWDAFTPRAGSGTFRRADWRSS